MTRGAFTLSPATAAPGTMWNCMPRWTSCWSSPRYRILRIRPQVCPRPVQLNWYRADDEDAASGAPDPR